MAISQDLATILHARMVSIPAATEMTGLLDAISVLSGTEAGYIDGVTPGTVLASKAAVVDVDKDITGFRNLTATGAIAGATGAFTYTTNTVANIQPFQVVTTLTGAGATGGQGLFQLNANAALGDRANALKGYTKVGSTGKITGLGSAICAELEMSAGCVDGTYAPLDVELVMPEDAVTGTDTHFIHCEVGGDDTAVALFDQSGSIMRIDGVSIDAGHAIAESVKDGVKSTHSMRISINGTPYYIPLSTAQDFNA